MAGYTLGSVYTRVVYGLVYPRWYIPGWCIARYTSLYALGGVYPGIPPCMPPDTLFVGVPRLPVCTRLPTTRGCTARWCVPFYTFSQEVGERRACCAKRPPLSLRNKPFQPGKPHQKGKETRYRESSRTRRAGISQPLLRCSPAPLKARDRLLTPVSLLGETRPRAACSD